MADNGKKTRAVVTGASGFIGSHLAERLMADGIQAACLVRGTSNRRWLEHLNAEVFAVRLDDRKLLHSVLSDADYIFHVAGLTKGRTEAQYRSVNVDGTRALLESAPETLKRFVYVSSLTAAGPNPTRDPINEETPDRPRDHYGRSKVAAEAVVRSFSDRLPISIVRPPAVYGPRDTNMLPVFRMAARFGAAPVIGSPQKQLSFVYVDDLVEGVCLAGTRDEAIGQNYYVASETRAWSDFVDALEAALDRKLRRFRLPDWVAKAAGEFGELKWTLTGKPQIICRRKIRDLLAERWTCAIAKAQRDLGYQPRTTLETGIGETVRFYREQGWL